MEGISHSVLLEIAKEIGDDVDKLSFLGYSLGFNRAQVRDFKKTNRIDGQITSNGTRQMLEDWIEQSTC